MKEGCLGEGVEGWRQNIEDKESALLEGRIAGFWLR